MIFNMSVGGGSGDLNFEVAGGTTRPTNPKENTLWVNTAVEFESWIFSADQPQVQEAGMVWFEVRPSGNLVFDALKGANVLNVAPIAARQYVDNNWELVTAEIYRDGSWETIEKTVWLLNGMNQYENITGGWLFAETGSISGAGVKFTRRDGGANALETAKTDIDFSPYSLLTVHISANSASSWAAITVGSSSVLAGSSAGGTPYAEVTVQNRKTGYIQLDLSKVNKIGKICFNCYDTGSVTIDEIYLEP